MPAPCSPPAAAASRPSARPARARRSRVAERRDAVDALVAAGVPAARILVSVSCAALPDTLALTRHAQDDRRLGRAAAAAVLLQGRVRCRHRRRLPPGDRRARPIAPLRVVLYHIPQVSGVGLSHAVIAELLRRYPQTHRRHQGQPVRPRAFAGAGRGLHAAAGRACRQRARPAGAGRRGSRGAVSGLANFMPRAGAPPGHRARRRAHGRATTRASSGCSPGSAAMR